MIKPIIIWQPGYIGDILFLQKFANHFAELGHRVIFPINPEYEWLRDGLEYHSNIEMPLTTEDYDFKQLIKFGRLIEQVTLEPIETAQFIFYQLADSWKFDPPRTMFLKYEVAGLDYTDWQSYVKIRRNPEKELFLYNGLNRADMNYVLVNEHYSRGHVPLFVPFPSIKMVSIDGFTLFDWCLILENADRIVTIDTSLVLLAEILGLTCKLHVVSRYNPPDFSPIRDLLKLDWQYALTIGDLNYEDVIV